jgi:hypothetical protein
MSLSTREQQALNSIEARLAASAPMLASLLAMFTRLTANEQLPARERIRSGRPLRRRPGASRRGRVPHRQLVWPALWLAVSIALVAVALAVGHDGDTPVCAARASACAWSALPAYPVSPPVRRTAAG